MVASQFGAHKLTSSIADFRDSAHACANLNHGGKNDCAVTVFGGTGFLGRRIVRYLRSCGFPVRVASRHPDLGYRLVGPDDPQLQSVGANIASGSRTMIAGFISSCIAGFLLSRRFSQSSGARLSCVGTGPALLLALEVALVGRATAYRHRVARNDPADERRKSALGTPRIHGELLNLGLEVAQSSVANYIVKRRGPPSQGWRTFLCTHAPDIAAMDLFVVRTIGFDPPYAFVIVRLDRRDLVWINVTANPTAWVARQIAEAFPWNAAPHYLICDRDRIYGSVVTRRLRAMGMRDKPTAPASPWQNGFAERLIRSIRCECPDHIVVFGEAHLRRIRRSYAHYYNDIRTASVIGQRCAGHSPNSANRKHQIARHPWRTSPPLRPSLSFRHTQP